MVHHATQADMFLEGDVVAALRLLAEALRASGVDADAVEARQGRWAVQHAKLWESNRAAEAEAAA